jgi:hypothetical protein
MAALANVVGPGLYGDLNAKARKPFGARYLQD